MKSRLEIDYTKERPSDSQVLQMWNEIKLLSLTEWSPSAKILKGKFEATHINGGIQLHKFQISDNQYLHWFSVRNRLNEIFFTQKIFCRPELDIYRKHLKIDDKKPKVKSEGWYTDIFDLAGILARILGQGGAYENLNANEAWETATNFVKDEFENRFNEFNRYTYEIINTNWFYDIAWDYSSLLFDKRKNQIILIDITDTD